MTQAIGSNTKISFTEEATYGVTPVTPSTKFLTFATYGESLVGNISQLNSNAISNVRAIPYSRGGAITVGGNLSMELALDGSIVNIYDGLMGLVDTTGTGPFDYTFKRGPTLKSYSIEKFNSDIAQQQLYKGCLFNSLQLTMGPNALITGSLAVVGKNFTLGTATIDATPEVVQHVPFAGYDGTIKLNGTTINVANLSLTVNNNVNAQLVVNSRYAYSQLPGQGSVEGSVEFLFEDATAITNALNDTSNEIVIELLYQGITHRYTIHKAFFTGDVTPAVANPNGMTLNLNFTGVLDTDEETDITIEVLNVTEALAFA